MGRQKEQDARYFNRRESRGVVWRSERKEWRVGPLATISYLPGNSTGKFRYSDVPEACKSVLTSSSTVEPLESRRPSASTKRS